MKNLLVQINPKLTSKPYDYLYLYRRENGFKHNCISTSASISTRIKIFPFLVLALVLAFSFTPLRLIVAILCICRAAAAWVPQYKEIEAHALFLFVLWLVSADHVLLFLRSFSVISQPSCCLRVGND